MRELGEEPGRAADLGRGKGKERPPIQREKEGGRWETEGVERRRGCEGPGARWEEAGERQ